MSAGPLPIGDDLLKRLPLSPDVYVHSFDLTRETALLVAFDAGTYRTASFLDQRALRPAMKAAHVPLQRVAENARLLQGGAPLHFIFHTGHVGSTLVSRLLEEADGVLALREPMPLRLLAETHDTVAGKDSLIGEAGFDALLAAFLRLWQRAYPATNAVVLKATSSAGRLAPLLMARQGGARAIYLNLKAEAYLAALLGGQNAAIDLRGHGPERMRRLQAFAAGELAPLHQLSSGELGALSWLAETWSQSNALQAAGARVLAVDFEGLLGDIRGAMERIVQHLGIAHSARFLDGVAQSPSLTRYAKGPEHAYSPQVRAQILAQSRAQNGLEIRKGLAWLERRAAANPAVAAVVTRGGLT